MDTWVEGENICTRNCVIGWGIIDLPFSCVFRGEDGTSGVPSSSPRGFSAHRERNFASTPPAIASRSLSWHLFLSTVIPLIYDPRPRLRPFHDHRERGNEASLVENHGDFSGWLESKFCLRPICSQGTVRGLSDTLERNIISLPLPTCAQLI